jgi:hypothetical protein
VGTVPVWSSVEMGTTGRKILEIIRLTAASLPYDYCITSGMDGDHGGVSHHYGLSYNGSPTAALDVGCWRSRSDPAARGRALAKALYAQSDLIVELIVSGVGSGLNAYGGYYVKNQRRVSPYAVSAHYDHIHLATSSALADQWLGRLKESPDPVMFSDLDLV